MRIRTNVHQTCGHPWLGWTSWRALRCSFFLGQCLRSRCTAAYADTTSRLAFVTLKDNVMVLSLRAMIVQFVILMVIAAFCFGGFLYALWTCVMVLMLPGAELTAFVWIV